MRNPFLVSVFWSRKLKGILVVCNIPRKYIRSHYNSSLRVFVSKGVYKIRVCVCLVPLVAGRLEVEV